MKIYFDIDTRQRNNPWRGSGGFAGIRGREPTTLRAEPTKVRPSSARAPFRTGIPRRTPARGSFDILPISNDVDHERCGLPESERSHADREDLESQLHLRLLGSGSGSAALSSYWRPICGLGRPGGVGRQYIDQTLAIWPGVWFHIPLPTLPADYPAHELPLARRLTLPWAECHHSAE